LEITHAAVFAAASAAAFSGFVLWDILLTLSESDLIA